MIEYIERKPILKFIENGLNNPDKSKAFGHDAIEILTEVQYAPVADVEPVRHGRWVERSDRGVISMTHPYECSRCGRVEMEKEPYCNCGAKMDGN